MALAVTVNFQFLDAKNKASSTKVRIPNGFSIAQMVEFAQGAAQVLTNLSGAILTKATICIALDISTATIKGIAIFTADIAQKLYVSIASTVAGFSKKLRIPALDEGLLNAGSDTIDQSTLNWSTFETAMVDGLVVTGGTIAPVDARGNDLAVVDEAYESFRGTK